MSFFKEIASILGMDEARLALGYNYVNYNGEAVYIEGIKSVLTVADTEMTFRLPRGVLYVEGTELRVDDLQGASVLVRGQILSVSTVAAEKRKRGKKAEKAGESV